MRRVVVFGAGRLGSKLASILSRDDAYDVLLIDAREEALDSCSDRISTKLLDAVRRDAVDQTLRKGDIVVAAISSSLSVPLASAALRKECHYLDFNESTRTTNEIASLTNNKSSILIPNCGFSPGILSALIANFTSTIDGLLDLDVYVGVLPRENCNRLGFGRLLQIDGLLDEYLDPATIRKDGEYLEIGPLSLFQNVTIRGVQYEAFTTGGMANRLPEATAARTRNYVFRTLRYPGHLDYILFLLNDLKLLNRRDMLRNLFINGLPETRDDEVVVRIHVLVKKGACEETHSRTWRVATAQDLVSPNAGTLYELAARQAAAVIDLVEDGTLKGPGLVRQADIPATSLLSNRHVREVLG